MGLLFSSLLFRFRLPFVLPCLVSCLLAIRFILFLGSCKAVFTSVCVSSRSRAARSHMMSPQRLICRLRCNFRRSSPDPKGSGGCGASAPGKTRGHACVKPGSFSAEKVARQGLGGGEPQTLSSYTAFSFSTRPHSCARGPPDSFYSLCRAQGGTLPGLGISALPTRLKGKGRQIEGLQLSRKADARAHAGRRGDCPSQVSSLTGQRRQENASATARDLSSSQAAIRLLS